MPIKKQRPWWRKKTNIAIALGIIAEGLVLHPVTLPFSPILMKIAIALGAYGVADRAGKPPEENK